MQFMMNQVVTFISVVIVVSLADWWMIALMVPLGLSNTTNRNNNNNKTTEVCKQHGQ